MIALAIDIGLTGALAAVDSYGKASVADLPTVADGKGRRLCGRGMVLLVRQLVPAGEPALLVFEDVRPRPMGNGGAHGNTMHSQGSLMRSRGIVEAVADIARVEVSTVQPATWKRHFGLIKAEKGASLDKARALFPALAAELRRVKDHNRAEALLLAHWLRGQKA
jgi:hypothetical protein